jgi:hypothetical protein
VGRLFLAITGPVLIILLVDSALHDPDVHPFVVGGMDRAARLVEAAPGWPGGRADGGEAATQSGAVRAASADDERTHSPIRAWYWSTILGMAVICLGLLKMARAVTFRNRLADPSRDRSVDPVRPESGP